MEDIRKVFTIQWVGPFDTFASLSEYLNDPNTCDCHLFSFYYCPGSKKVKGIPLARMTIGILASIALEHQYIREWLLGTNI